MAGAIKMSDKNYGSAWSVDFELGHELVDAQHRRLFELINQLLKACTDGYDTKVLKVSIDYLVNYTVQHFRDEEALLLEVSFHGYERHKQLHEGFKVSIAEIVQKFDINDSTTELSKNLNRIFVRWLINHIQREDRKIIEHIRFLERTASYLRL